MHKYTVVDFRGGVLYMIVISNDNLEAFLRGSLLYASGGGLLLEESRAFMIRALSRTPEIEVIPPAALPPNGFLVSLQSFGSVEMDEIRALLERFEELFGFRIAGIVPRACGSEGLAFLAASLYDLPVVDTDLVGGRGASDPLLNLFGVFNLPVTPILARAKDGKELFITGEFSLREAQDMLASFAKTGGGAIAVGFPIKADALANLCVPGTISRSAREFPEGKIVGCERITSVSGDRIDLGPLRIKIKNEHLVLAKGKRILAAAPDGIALVREDGTPIHSAEISTCVGQEVTILKLPALGYWTDPKARRLWKRVMR